MKIIINFHYRFSTKPSLPYPPVGAADSRHWDTCGTKLLLASEAQVLNCESNVRTMWRKTVSNTRDAI